MSHKGRRLRPFWSAGCSIVGPSAKHSERSHYSMQAFHIRLPTGHRALAQEAYPRFAHLPEPQANTLIISYLLYLSSTSAPTRYFKSSLISRFSLGAIRAFFSKFLVFDFPPPEMLFVTAVSFCSYTVHSSFHLKNN